MLKTFVEEAAALASITSSREPIAESGAKVPVSDPAATSHRVAAAPAARSASTSSTPSRESAITATVCSGGARTGASSLVALGESLL